MEEVWVVLLYIGLFFLAEISIAVICAVMAGKKGRDTIGWFFNGLFLSVLGLLIILFLPALEPPGQSRRLRLFYLYLFLFIILMLIVFGFIGYYCVPNEPLVAGEQAL